jgi:hypothetical protein
MIQKVVRLLYTAELQEEKRKDYRNVVTAQAILLAVSLLTDDWLHHELTSFVVFQLCAAVYLGLLWDLSRNFTFRKWIPRSLGVLAVAVVLTSLVYNFFFYSKPHGPVVNAILHSLTVLVQVVVMALGLRDLVRGPRTASDKLWAASGLYIMLGIAFGELIHVLHLLQPGTLGPDILPSVKGFHEALYVSFVTLTGCDNDLKTTSHFCRNLLVIEALLAQLYMVMLISRLLMPDELPRFQDTDMTPEVEGQLSK